MIKGTLRRTAIVIILFLFFAPFSRASEPQDEIDHLIGYVRESGCAFIRNGDEHDPEAALEHILRKYEYFKSRIRSAEDFIAHCATKSTMTGQFYETRCDGHKAIPTKQWLTDELKRYRTR